MDRMAAGRPRLPASRKNNPRRVALGVASGGCAGADARRVSRFGVVFSSGRDQSLRHARIDDKVPPHLDYHLGARDGREHSAVHRYPPHEYSRALGRAPPAAVVRAPKAASLMSVTLHGKRIRLDSKVAIREHPAITCTL